jgi:hypothetical protein
MSIFKKHNPTPERYMESDLRNEVFAALALGKLESIAWLSSASSTALRIQKHSAAPRQRRCYE